MIQVSLVPISRAHELNPDPLQQGVILGPLHEKLALLAKIEASYGVDAVPTGAANAIQVTNASYDVGHEEISRTWAKPFMGHDGVILVGKHVVISFDVEIAGPGVEGIQPAQLALRMAGFSKISCPPTLSTSLRSKDFEAGSLYYNLDGVNHVSLGTRGQVKLSLGPKEIPALPSSSKGLLVTSSTRRCRL